MARFYPTRIPVGKLVWLFILAVALWDVGTAWRFRATLPEWEANPAALAVYRLGGITALVIYRTGLLAFAWRASRLPARSAGLVTWTAGLVHLALAVQLLRAWDELPKLP